MRYRLVIVVVVGLWAVMMASLVRRWLLEVKPEFVPGTYRSVLTPERQNYHCRMGIFWQQKKVGYSETVFYYSDDERYRITNITRVQAAVPGDLEKLAAFGLDTNVVVGKGHALESFAVVLSSPVMGAECKGEVVEGELVLRARVDGEEDHVRRLPLPPGGMVASGLSPLLALPPLRVGLRWTTLVLNPLTLEPSEVELHVLRLEPLVWHGETWNTHVVEIRSGLVTAHAWVSPNGEVLKETTLFGLTLVKEPLLDEAPEREKGSTRGATDKKG
ncbi:MAG TPA: hypothetical protein VNE39_21370 [Planctomycetota bacterium]|nr:hypothetical protein [Planctomycetota bacterium]